VDLTALLGLLALALVDSTSMGTLVLPLLMLLAPRVHVGRFCVYLATVAGFYAIVGIALVAGAQWLVDVGSELGQSRPLRWAELVAGSAMFAIGVFGDPRSWFGRRRAEGEERPDARTAQWRERLIGPQASYGAVVGVGVVAALIEVGSMLPFLAAVAVITSAGLPVVGWVSVVLAYVVVMVLPALVLLALRVSLGHRVEGSLARISGWLGRHTGNALYWALAIVGFVLMGDATAVLFE
jgi:hypothetical protein